jgi:2'-hydroxyisoflavone reductase
MHILILGGTVFLGRTLVQAALASGHHLTLFNRGRSNPDLFPHIDTITGDRAGDLSALSERCWDAVIDTCGYYPRLVRHSARALAQSVAHYTFISSISVYADTSQPGVNESDPVGKLADESIEEITGKSYGPLKALCEQAVEAEMPARALVIRPGLIVGPWDASDRFTYWPVRVSRGGEVLAPGRPDRGLQIIDVRDLAEWIIRLIEAGSTGLFNADGLPAGSSMGQLLETCRQISGSQALFTWVDEAFLLEHQVVPWTEMPLWIPETDPQAGGFFAVSVQKAVAAGLTYRPLHDTLRDTLDWAAARPADHKWRAGMTAGRETELLALWEKRK